MSCHPSARWAAFGALALGLASAAPASAAPLQPFTDPLHTFTVRMPAPVKADDRDIPTRAGKVAVHIFLHQAPRGTYVVSYNDYPPGVLKADPTTILKGAAQGAAANTGCKVTSLKQVAVGGLSGVEAAYSNAQMQGRTRVYLVGRRLYQTTIIVDARAGMGSEASAFLASFRAAKH